MGSERRQYSRREVLKGLVNGGLAVFALATDAAGVDLVGSAIGKYSEAKSNQQQGFQKLGHNDIAARKDLKDAFDGFKQVDRDAVAAAVSLLIGTSGLAVAIYNVTDK